MKTRKVTSCKVTFITLIQSEDERESNGKLLSLAVCLLQRVNICAEITINSRQSAAATHTQRRQDCRVLCLKDSHDIFAHCDKYVLLSVIKSRLSSSMSAEIDTHELRCLCVIPAAFCHTCIQ